MIENPFTISSPVEDAFRSLLELRTGLPIDKIPSDAINSYRMIFMAGATAMRDNAPPISRPTIEAAWQDFRSCHASAIGAPGYEGTDPEIALWRACFMSGAAAAVSAIGASTLQLMPAEAARDTCTWLVIWRDKETHITRASCYGSARLVREHIASKGGVSIYLDSQQLVNLQRGGIV